MNPDLAGITVRDNQQVAVEPREEWRKSSEKFQILRWSGEGVDPAKEIEISLNLTKWFDLTPGDYFVQLSPEATSFDDPLLRERQKSNVLQIRIVPK
jgi:hypothetical protein